MNELKKLIAELEKAGMINNTEEELLAEDIADVLWLLLYANKKQNEHISDDVQQPFPQPEPQSPSIPLKSASKKPELARPDLPRWKFPHITEPNSQNDTVELYLRDSSRPNVSKSGARTGLQARSPAAPALPHTLNIARALRPLMRRIPSYTRFQLDEQATTHLIAEMRGSIWAPVMKPASTRWLEIALVIDTGASMAPWHRTIDELRFLLEHQGAFRDVRIWRLKTDAKDRVALYAGTNMNAQQERNPKELIDPTNRRLILLVSDCVSSAWHSGQVQQVLDLWGKSNVVTLIHTFPRRMWERTALRQTDTVDVRVTHLNNGNAGVEIAGGGWKQKELIERMAEQGFTIKASLPIPVITLKPETVSNWAHMISGAENAWTLGAIFYQGLPDLATMTSSAQVNVPSVRDLVEQFRYAASPIAYQLLKYLSVAPISFPVIHLIQQAMLPHKAKQEHVAEVFLSGLIEEIPRDKEAINNHDDVEYDFLIGVREVLREGISLADEFAVIEAVSTYLGDRYGHLRDFNALATVPSSSPGGDIVPINETKLLFARLVASTWRRMGGISTEWAKNLEQKISSLPGEGINDRQRSSEDSHQKVPVKSYSTQKDHSKTIASNRPISSPQGITLLHALAEHKSEVKVISWSPDGRLLAAGSNDGTVLTWDTEQGKLLYPSSKGHISTVVALEWSYDGRRLTSRAANGTISVWDTREGRSLNRLKSMGGEAPLELWSPDGQLLAISSPNGKIRIWKRKRAELQHILQGHNDEITAISWSPDSKLLASGFYGGTICVWDANQGELLCILEGPIGKIGSVSWSPNGKMLAASAIVKGGPSTASINIWRTDSWELVAKLSDLQGEAPVAWNPHQSRIATVGQRPEEILIWQGDIKLLLGQAPSPEAMHYANAKVVLVGDNSVGKSGLALVLTGQKFAPTESTHNRHVWLLDQKEVQQAGGLHETREVWLWDLAGQPDYQLIHQLHLHEATVAVIVFDGTKEAAALNSIRNWQQALQLAQQDQGSSALPLTILLVAARIDRGSNNISQARIDQLLKELGIARYIETSAKDGRGIAELGQAVHAAIDWAKLPRVSSTKLLYSIKSFLLREQQAGRLLRSADDLYEAFLRTQTVSTSSNELRQQFTIVLSQLIAQGIIRSLGFGNLILLQPELLDTYASALLIAVKNEPDELGSIVEARVQQGQFEVPTEERLPDQAQEKLLLIAMIDELVRHELALRESGFLLFPSQSRREHPDYEALASRQVVIFSFTGPVLSLYTTLVVRLAQSGIFHKQELWRYVATYTTQLDASGTCGLLLSPQGGEQAQLGIFFDESISEDMRFLFEDFVLTHLEKHTVETIQRSRIFTCPACGEIFSTALVNKLRDRSLTSMNCMVCGKRVSLLDGAQRLSKFTVQVRMMEQTADNQRNRESADLILQGKIATQDFDVFLCYNQHNKQAALTISERLKYYGILSWLDKRELYSESSQQIVEEQIARIKTVVIFVGKDDPGFWRQQEASLRGFMERGSLLLLALFSGASSKPDLPDFLQDARQIDFRVMDPDPIQCLLECITGKEE